MNSNLFNELCMNRIKHNLTNRSDENGEYLLNNPNTLHKIG